MSDIDFDPNLSAAELAQAKRSRQARHNMKLAAALSKLPTFSTDLGLNDYLATLPPEQAHYAWLASLEHNDYERVVAEGAHWYVDPNARRYSTEYDADRDDIAAAEVATERRTANSKMVPAGENQAFDLGRAIRAEVLHILSSGDIEAALWGLALHSGAAEELGINTQTEVCERIGVSKQSLNAYVQSCASRLGPISGRYHATTPTVRTAPHYRKSRTLADALR